MRWLKAFFTNATAARRTLLSDRRLRTAERQNQRTRKALRKRERELRALMRQIDDQRLSMEAEIEQAKELARLQEETINGLRAELTTATEVTIPSLVAANNLAMERMEADTAIQVRRKVVMTPGVEE